ncbi:hypothetical protein YC2023_051965 [Brassica napus]
MSLRICLCLFSSMQINQNYGRSPRRTASPNKYEKTIPIQPNSSWELQGGLMHEK